MAKKQSNQFRIVGGDWRGRKFPFVDGKGLRPTLDRVRETLFNWLQMDIYQARCLDLFAGSGALSFEALSRGASHVTLVDNYPQTIRQIENNLQLLKCPHADTFLGSAEKFIQQYQADENYQIVFLDPPFKQNLLPSICRQLEEKQILSDSALIYIEAEQQLKLDNLPQNWQQLKNRKAGQLGYYLYQQLE